MLILVFYFCTFNIIQNNLQHHVWLINIAIITVYQPKNPQKYIHYSLEILNTGKNGILYICFLKYLTKIFKKLKLPSTEFYVYMAQVDTQNSVNSIKKALFTILRII